MVLIQMRVNCTLNLLQADQENIPILQAKKVQWHDYHCILVLLLYTSLKPLLLATVMQRTLGQLCLWSQHHSHAYLLKSA